MFFDIFLGGGEKAKQRHVARNKLLPRERVLNLLDNGYIYLHILTCGKIQAMKVISSFIGCNLQSGSLAQKWGHSNLSLSQNQVELSWVKVEPV